MKAQHLSRLLALLLALALSGPALAEKKSLYERLGGAHQIAYMVDDFIDRLLKDPVVGANPKVAQGMAHITVPGLKFHVTNLLCQAAGGQEKYTGRTMTDSHKDLAIDEAQWKAAADIMRSTLNDFGVGPEESKEVMELIGSLKSQIVKPHDPDRPW